MFFVNLNMSFLYIFNGKVDIVICCINCLVVDRCIILVLWNIYLYIKYSFIGI